ncbi:MAG: restriction endonuclease [archaeon]
MENENITKNREKIIRFVRANPSATDRLIRNKLKLHPNRYFKGMEEIFKTAKVKYPRSFKRKTKEEKRKIIIDLIRKNPKIGGHTIRKKTKINIDRIFESIKEAYEEAEVKYPRKESYDRSPNEKRKEIIKVIKENPYLTLLTLQKKVRIKNIYRLFKDLDEIYEKAGIKKVSQGEKIRNRKIKNVINFIKKNPLATQREINSVCRTHVQYLFNRGIFEAYEKADVKYPYERTRLYGTALKEIKKRAKDFEKEMAIKLLGYGKVNKLIKTKRGVVDIILERKKEKIAIEIKDYKNKEVSFSQVKQLIKYMEDLDTNYGILICHKKPKKDKFIIGKNKIFILEKQELDKIPNLIDKGLW